MKNTDYIGEIPNLSFLGKCILSGEMYPFWGNVSFLRKCILSEEMYPFWGNVSFLRKCILSGERILRGGTGLDIIAKRFFVLLFVSFDSVTDRFGDLLLSPGATEDFFVFFI